MASSYVGGGRSQRLAKVLPRKEKKREEDLQGAPGENKENYYVLCDILLQSLKFPRPSHFQGNAQEI